MSSLPAINQTLTTAIKKHAEVDIKLFFSFPILLDFSTLVKHFVRDRRLIRKCRIQWWCSFTVFHFPPLILFLGKNFIFLAKIQNCQFKLNYGA